MSLYVYVCIVGFLDDIKAELVVLEGMDKESDVLKGKIRKLERYE